MNGTNGSFGNLGRHEPQGAYVTGQSAMVEEKTRTDLERLDIGFGLSSNRLADMLAGLEARIDRVANAPTSTGAGESRPAPAPGYATGSIVSLDVTEGLFRDRCDKFDQLLTRLFKII